MCDGHVENLYINHKVLSSEYKNLFLNVLKPLIAHEVSFCLTFESHMGTSIFLQVSMFSIYQKS